MNKHGLTRHAALIGSNWNNGDNASPFNWNLNNATSNVNRNIGTHTIFVKSRGLVQPCLLAKHRNKKTCAGRGLPAFESSVITQRPVGALP